MNSIESTFSFKLKIFSSGQINIFKAIICAWDDHKLEGVDYVDTYAPVVQWNTVRLMLILEVILDLK